jgi:release factor glutamine methyltransferase
VETLRTTRVGSRVLDVGTGTGVLALAAARGGATQVIAVDSCTRAVFAARVNAWLRRSPVRVVRSDLGPRPGESERVPLCCTSMTTMATSLPPGRT